MINKYLNIIIILIISLLMTACNEYSCDQSQKMMYCVELNGKLIRKYIKNEAGRPINHFSILGNNGVVYDVKLVHNYSYYKTQINDSVVKPIYTFDFSFFRKDSLVLNMRKPIPCVCDSIGVK